MKRQKYTAPEAQVIRMDMISSVADTLPSGSGTVDSGDIEGKETDFEDDFNPSPWELDLGNNQGGQGDDPNAGFGW